MTSIDYEASTKAYRRHKAAVTRLRNRKGYVGVILECQLAFADFDKYGWVDDWARFVREAEDALFKLRQQVLNDEVTEEVYGGMCDAVDAMRGY